MKQFLMALTLVAIWPPAWATRIEFGKNTVINKPVYEDLYIAGADITINAPVYGDLVVAGGTVTINDTVTNDILVAGGTVVFNGYVADDIRCAGGRLKILKNVAGDVVAAGGDITVGKDVAIGNLIVSGGTVTVAGIVNGTVQSMTGKLLLSGLVKKSIDCRGGTITIDGAIQGPAVLAANDKISIGSAASFGNGVRYWAPGKQTDFRQSVRAGQVIYDPSLRIDSERWYYLGFASALGVVLYLGMAFLMIMIIQYLFSATMKKAADTAYDKAWRSVGFGLLYWIGIPIAAVVACITVIGIPVGLLLLFGYVALLMFATTITSVVAANWLNNRSATHFNYWRLVFTSLGVFVVLRVLGFTPFLGWFILLALICIAFGAIIQNINWRRKPVQPGS